MFSIIHKKKFGPVIGEFLEREAPYLRSLEDFKIKTGYVDYLDGGSKKRSKKRSKI